jgi:DnaJ-related protein SCJ1
MQISLEEALLGYRKNVVHLDNRKVVIKHDEITKPFDVRTIQGEGMPHHNYPSQHGDLHVLHHILFPRKLSEAQKAMVEELLAE